MGALRLLTVGVTGRRDLKKVLKLVEDLLLHLEKQDVKVLVDRDLALSHPSERVREAAGDNKAIRRADVVVTIGGDGTILRAVRKFGAPLRVLGVNMGSMGFLCEVDPPEVFSALDKIIRGEYRVQRARMLSLFIDGVCRDYALNDVFVFTPKPAKVIDFKVDVDGVEVFSGRADGALISTAVGSTAYAISANGPLIDPELDCLELVIMNPLNLGVKPFIFSSSSTVRVTFPPRSRRGAAVYCDGVLTAVVQKKSVIEVKLSELYVDFLRVKEVRSTFYRKFYEIRIRGERR
ncbi:MAG: hypothetical protein DRJ68_01500 [Thermoprotei archaeon]|nr:MAG: hypothetical protein DRJ68_01500 [Thermoprotei archaeon]